jgi:hypothetical protein
MMSFVAVMLVMMTRRSLYNHTHGGHTCGADSDKDGNLLGS